MGFLELRGEITAEYSGKVASLEEETRRECDRVISSAESEAERMVAASEANAAFEARMLEMRELASARLEVRKTLADAMEKVVEKVFDSVNDALVGFSESAEYREFLPKIADSAASKVHGVALVYARKKDSKLIRKHKVAPSDLDCIGGVVVKSKDSSVVVDATLESLFSASKPELRVSIYRRLFS